MEFVAHIIIACLAISFLNSLMKSLLTSTQSSRFAHAREFHRLPRIRTTDITRFVPIVLIAWLVTFGLVPLKAQTPAESASQTSPQPQHVDQATDVVRQWQANQHLYVKGDLGVSAAKLAALEQWLDQNATNWVVVLVESAQGERYTDANGRSFSGMNAVENALGKGLPNQTAFGQWTDPRTGERDGAFFVLFLKERKFSYYGSDAQDRHGLGEDRWVGRLDRPAIAAMRSGGRIVDAVKDTITNIDRQLTQQIATEKRRREQQAAAAQAAKQRALENAKASLLSGTAAVDLLDQKLADLLKQHPDLSGEIARPDVPQMRADLSSAQAALESNNPTAASSLANQVKQHAMAAVNAIASYLSAEPELKDVSQSVEQTAAQPYHQAAQAALASARAELTQAQQAYERGEAAYAEHLLAARQQIQRSQAQIQATARAAAQQSALLAAGSIAGLICLGLVGIFLNRRRRGNKQEALALLEAWSKALSEKSLALVDLLERTQTLLGTSSQEVTQRFAGQTLELGQQVVRDVDELFIMSACAGRVHRDAQAKAAPASMTTRAYNFFAAGNYRAAIRKLRDEPIVFHPEEGLELALRGPKSSRDTLLGPLESYQPFTRSFAELITAFNQRAERGLAGLDRIDSSLKTVGTILETIQQTVQSTRAFETSLQSAGDADQLFLVGPVFTELLPAAQQDLSAAQVTAVRDPVGALEVQAASARQRSDDAQTLAQLARKFQAELRPQLREAAQQLAAVPLHTGWIDVAVADMSMRADQLAIKALQDSIAEPAAKLAEDLNQMMVRTTRIVALDQARREVAQLSVTETEATILATRKELAVPLGKKPEAILREPDRDPSDRLALAREQLTATKAALERGDVASAQEGLDAVARLVAEATSLVEATRTAFNEHKKTLADRVQETARLEKEIPAHEQILLDIRTRYVPSVLQLGQGDPAHPDANGTIQDNLDEVRQHLAAARELSERAAQLFRDAQLLQAAECWRLTAARQDQTKFRLEEIVDKQQRIRDTEAANDQLQSNLGKRFQELAPTISDVRTMLPTQQAFAAAREQLDEVDPLRKATPRDPFEVASRLDAVQEALDHVVDQARCDWDVYAEADRSLQAAAAQLEIARRLDREAATDNVQDSAAIQQASGELTALAGELDQAQNAFARPHEDWSRLDAEADRITSEAGRIAAVLRGELQAAQNALAALSAAATHVRSAGAWTGAFGVAILGSPGSDWLGQARSLLGQGDYAQALLAAQSARRAAEAAIIQAQAEVQRRRRAEEERRERERRQRQAEERRRRNSLSHSWLELWQFRFRFQHFGFFIPFRCQPFLFLQRLGGQPVRVVRME